MPFATLDICVAQVGGFVAFCRLFVNLCCDTAYFNAQGGFLHCVESFCRRQVNTHKILCSLYRRCIPFKRKGQVANVLFVVTFSACRRRRYARHCKFVQVSLLRMNEMVKNDMAKPLKTF